MIKELRLAWEPENCTPLPVIESRMLSYGVKGMTIMGNGSLLVISGEVDVESNARRALDEARFLTDFRTVSLKEGGYMVQMHKAVAVFIGDEEFARQEKEIEARIKELSFPGEVFFSPEATTGRENLIGLYGRGKLQRDCYAFNLYKRIAC